VIADNAALAVELGAPGIDLNFGCPAKTVNRHDGGATLLKNPDRLFDIITAVKAAVPTGTPVTAKVRLGFDCKDRVCEIAQAVDSAGADRLTVHARTKVEGYKPPAHWTYIAKMKDAIVRVPIFANGDIWTVEDYYECVRQTGLTNIALGRPAIACPDLARQIKSAVDGVGREASVGGDGSNLLLWQEIRANLLLEFIEMNIVYRDANYAVARIKQWVKLLGRQDPESADLFEEIKRLKSIEDIKMKIKSGGCLPELSLLPILTVQCPA